MVSSVVAQELSSRVKLTLSLVLASTSVCPLREEEVLLEEEEEKGVM